MSNAKEAIDGLDKAIDLEHRVMEYYKRAGDEAASGGHTAKALFIIEQNHQMHIERLQAERERMHEQDGAGFLAEALNSFGDALSSVVAGVPRSFIEAETFPTPETLVRCEEQLIEHYGTLRQSVGAEVATVIDATIVDCRNNIATLRQLDTLH